MENLSESTFWTARFNLDEFDKLETSWVKSGRFQGLNFFLFFLFNSS